MVQLPVPDNEEERLAALQRYAILDTPPEVAFDRLTALAARLFEVPVALISLVDEERQWFKSCGGTCRGSLPAETSREIAFCAYTILSQEVLVVEDARLDPRFAENPLVTGPMGLRFYAGAPLVLSDGNVLGSLCLLDFTPRSFTARQRQSLQDLAAGVVSELELRRALSAATESEHRYEQLFADNPQPMWVYDNRTYRFLAVNDTAVAHFGYSQAEFLGMTLFDIRPAEDAEVLRRTLQTNSKGTRFVGLRRCLKKDRSLVWMEITSHCVEFSGCDARLAVAIDVTERKAAEDALRASEQKLALHIQQMPLAAMEIKPDMTVASWNAAAERTFGYTSAEAVGQNVQRLIVPKDEHLHVEQVRDSLITRTGGTRSINHNRTKSGEIILCDWHNTPLMDETGQVIGCASLARDITEEADAHERLRQSEAQKAAILDAALDCIISIDREGCVIEWNPAAERTFGWPGAEALGQRVTDLILPPPLRPAYQDGLAYYLETGGWPAFNRRVELAVQRRDGSQFEAELAAASLTTEAQPIYTIYLRDITERKAMERERESLLAQTESLLTEALKRADYDPLTGLLNHRAFHKRLNEEIDVKEMDAASQIGRRGAVLLIDLDNFKFFNDAYGHVAGDDVLRQVAQAFGVVCLAQDTLARFGGDEFALLRPGASQADAQRLADSLREAASRVGYTPLGHQTAIPFSLSVGIACFPEDIAAQASLLETADARLRIAKSGGDNESPARQIRLSVARSVGGFTMLDALVTAVDNKDQYTRRHSEDVLVYSLQIAQELGLDAVTQHTVQVAALLHDVGKIGIPDAILRKPGRLTSEEFEAIQQHPMMGAVIVGAVPGFEETLDAVRHHHERWDGAGYPFGLHGEETPLSARLMAVADAYSAMTTDRPYRKGMDPQKALCILENGAGTQWDPQCIGAFLAVRRRECRCG